MIQKCVDKSHIKALKLKKYIAFIDMFLSCLFSNFSVSYAPSILCQKAEQYCGLGIQQSQLICSVIKHHGLIWLQIRSTRELFTCTRLGSFSEYCELSEGMSPTLV